MELRAGLAPDEPPLGGGRSLELAEWLSMAKPWIDPSPQTPVVLATPPAVADVASLVERWVKRVALGGDQRRGIARLDIGQGRFAGAELVVVAEAGRVSVELSLPSDTTAPGMAERLRSRLELRGLSAEVTIR